MLGALRDGNIHEGRSAGRSTVSHERVGETRRADTVAFPSVLHSVYGMSGSCIQHGDELSNATLLSHSATDVANERSRSKYNILTRKFGSLLCVKYLTRLGYHCGYLALA